MTIGIFIQLFSYIPYAAAFIPEEGESGPVINTGLVAIGVVVAPLVFSSIGLISRRSGIPRQVLLAMGSLLLLGFALGLLSPIVGAAAGFGVGIALTLNMPGLEGQLRRRLLGVGLAVAYMIVMLVLIPPAGVLAGAVLPGVMVGFADEYGAWREARSR